MAKVPKSDLLARMASLLRHRPRALSHGVPGAGTAGVVAILGDDAVAVAGHNLYVHDPLFP